jgi:hypothetical protein
MGRSCPGGWPGRTKRAKSLVVSDVILYTYLGTEEMDERCLFVSTSDLNRGFLLSRGRFFFYFFFETFLEKVPDRQIEIWWITCWYLENYPGNGIS